MEMKKTPRLAMKEWGVIIVLAALLGWFVSSFFEPLTDEQRQWYQLKATEDLPQNR